MSREKKQNSEGSKPSEFFLPLPCKPQNPTADVEDPGIGNWPLLFNELHRGFGGMALRNQNRRTHGHTAMTPLGTVGIHFSPVADGFQRRLGTLMEFPDWNQDQRAVDRPQSEKIQRFRMQVGVRSAHKAHIDHQPHSQIPQEIVIRRGWRCADKQVAGDL